MNYKAILGAAAGAGLLYFLTTPKGKTFFRSIVGGDEDKYKEIQKSRKSESTHQVAEPGNG